MMTVEMKYVFNLNILFICCVKTTLVYRAGEQHWIEGILWITNGKMIFFAFNPIQY